LFLSTTGLALAGRTHNGATGTQDVLCALFPILGDFDLKRETFTELGALAPPLKGRDVNKYLRATLSGRDESEAAIIIPFCESAFDAHMKGVSLELDLRKPRQRHNLGQIDRRNPLGQPGQRKPLGHVP
jgi:hypothetical protein